MAKKFQVHLQNTASVFEVRSLAAAAIEKETSGCKSAELYAFCNALLFMTSRRSVIYHVRSQDAQRYHVKSEYTGKPLYASHSRQVFS